MRHTTQVVELRETPWQPFVATLRYMYTAALEFDDGVAAFDVLHLAALYQVRAGAHADERGGAGVENGEHRRTAGTHTPGPSLSRGGLRRLGLGSCPHAQPG